MFGAGIVMFIIATMHLGLPLLVVCSLHFELARCCGMSFISPVYP